MGHIDLAVDTSSDQNVVSICIKLLPIDRGGPSLTSVDNIRSITR